MNRSAADKIYLFMQRRSRTFAVLIGLDKYLSKVVLMQKLYKIGLKRQFNRQTFFLEFWRDQMHKLQVKQYLRSPEMTQALKKVPLLFEFRRKIKWELVA